MSENGLSKISILFGISTYAPQKVFLDVIRIFFVRTDLFSQIIVIFVFVPSAKGRLTLKLLDMGSWDILTYYCAITLMIIAYLLGSIPSAVWIGKKYYGIDIREHGSKNAGTTNMLRVLLGKRAAAPVFAIDFFKGFVAVMLISIMNYDDSINQAWLINLRIIAVFAVVLGHIFPIFAGFKGGKGVATLIGAITGIYPSYRAALLRNMVPRADDLALRLAGLDRGGMLLPDLRHDILHDDLQPCGAAAVDTVHRILVGRGDTAYMDSSQEHRASESRHRVEDIHLAERGAYRTVAGRAADGIHRAGL